MADIASRTVACSVLIAELDGFARLATVDQVQRKRTLSARIAQEVAQVPRAERVVQEFESGVLVAFLADPEAALVAALGLRAAGAALPLRVGLSFGTVHVAPDLQGRTTAVGDAVTDAQRVAARAAPGRPLAAGAFRDVVARLSADHASVFQVVELRSDARGREEELHEIRMPGGDAAPAAPAASAEASVFDAGTHMIVSGPERAAVQKALDELTAKGARISSPITRVGDKWMASCDHPAVRASECKVEKFGLTSVVTGPTREAVAARVEDLVERGARLQGEIEQDGGTWTAVLDSGGTG